MKQIFFLILSLGILGGAYAMTFGVPPQVASAIQGVAPGLLPSDGDAGDNSDAPAAGGRPAAGGPAAGGRSGRNRATTVVLAPLEQESYALTLRTFGSATSLNKASVRIAETGEVVEADLRSNMAVQKGDVLLRLDDRTQRLALDIAEAELDKARDTATRYRSLQASGNLTITDVTLSEAEVALRLAQANVGMAEVALEERTLVAPISGRLGLTDVQVGDWVSAGDIIVTIDDSSTLFAEFEVPERSIKLLEMGKTVLIGTPTYTGRVFEGQITAFDSRLDSVTRSATVQAEIDNSDRLLLSGMTFTIRMIEETDPLPIVPATAVTWDRSGAGVWVSDGGRVSREPITIRYREGDRLWIDTELPLGAMIVTEGAAKLRDGATVTDANAVANARSKVGGPRVAPGDKS